MDQQKEIMQSIVGKLNVAAQKGNAAILETGDAQRDEQRQRAFHYYLCSLAKNILDWTYSMTQPPPMTALEARVMRYICITQEVHLPPNKDLDTARAWELYFMVMPAIMDRVEEKKAAGDTTYLDVMDITRIVDRALSTTSS